MYTKFMGNGSKSRMFFGQILGIEDELGFSFEQLGIMKRYRILGEVVGDNII